MAPDWIFSDGDSELKCTLKRKLHMYMHSIYLPIPAQNTRQNNSSTILLPVYFSLSGVSEWKKHNRGIHEHRGNVVTG